ncbi:MAG: DNA recombination protein RmuC, partial [Candidatus Omnitrophica bacterium]|nr:DNA recombination protein RmuC [Candidatus Omnitrophota bacterium]
YQIAKDEELSNYTKTKKIVFVSPNTFYAYLQAILYGLKGVNIQRNIQKIFADLSRIQMDFSKFQDDFNTLGKHISDAETKYSNAGKKLEQLQEKLIATTQKPELEQNKEND